MRFQFYYALAVISILPTSFDTYQKRFKRKVMKSVDNFACETRGTLLGASSFF